MPNVCPKASKVGRKNGREGSFPPVVPATGKCVIFCGRRDPMPTGLEPRQAKGQTCPVGLLDKGSPGSVPRPFRIHPASVDMEGGRPGA